MLHHLMICTWNILHVEDLIGLLSQTLKQPNTPHLLMGTIYACTRKPAQSMLHTREHYVCLQGTVYIVL